MRFIKVAFWCSSLALAQIMLLFLSFNVVLGGALCGIVCGVLFSVVTLRRYFRLARESIFIDEMDSYEKKTLFSVLFVIIAFGVLGAFLITHYFPQFNLKTTYLTLISFFVFISFAIDALGIYFLERHYNEKFYIGKRKG